VNSQLYDMLKIADKNCIYQLSACTICEIRC